MNDSYIYPGCLILYRFPEYEHSAVRVLEKLGINAKNLPGGVCCGSFMEGQSDRWAYLAAYNLSLAERTGKKLITLCGGCTCTFNRLKRKCSENAGFYEEINKKLNKLGLKFNNTVQVKHILQVLWEHRKQLSELSAKKLGLSAALIYPCQVFRPSDLSGLKEGEQSRVLEKLLEPAGIKAAHYEGEWECCGSSTLLSNEELALKLGEKRLAAIKGCGSQMIVTACGNCHLLLDRLQPRFIRGEPVPGIFITQLLGVSLGLSPQEVSIKSSRLRRLLHDA
jgi:heterodisulfide reductase subunit B